jgi:hypothetical protein
MMGRPALQVVHPSGDQQGVGEDIQHFLAPFHEA